MYPVFFFYVIHLLYDVLEDKACRGRRRGDGVAVVKEAVCLNNGNYKYKSYECPDETTCIEGVCVAQE